MALNKDIFSDAFEELEENIDKNIEKTKKAQDRVSFEFTEDDLVEPSLTPQEKEKSLAENNKKADENLSAGVNELGESVKEEVRQVGKHEVFDPNTSDKGEALRNALFGDEENIKNCFNIINPKTSSFKAIFVGNPAGYKIPAIENISKLLFSIKKISQEIPVFLAFSEIENQVFEKDTLYVINDLADAIINLFNSEVSEQSNTYTAKYKRLLDKLLKLPNNLYIILDCDKIDYKSFLQLDARIRYIFPKVCFFEDFSDKKIAEDFLAETGSSNSLENVSEWIYNNRKFLPFQNQDLTEYLVNYYNENGALPEDRYKPFALEEAFKNIIGMDDVKNQIRDLESFLKARKLFEEAGIKQPTLRMNFLLTGSPGTGKALSTSTRVITKEGTRQAKDIVVGDILYNRFGQEVKVKGVFPQPKRNVYKVSFDDGTFSLVDEEHIWLVQDYKDRKTSHLFSKRKQSYKTLTTKEILETGFSLHRSDGLNRRIFSVPFCSPVSFPKRVLPISHSKFSQFLFSENVSLSKTELLFLKNLNLTSCDPSQFFIPEEFIYSSISQREEFIKQLFRFKKLTFTNTGIVSFRMSLNQEQLIEDVIFLFRSLGAKVRKQDGGPKSAIIRVTFPYDISYLLTKEIDLSKYRYKENMISFCKFITQIEFIREEPTVCFYVENNSAPIAKKGMDANFYELSFSNGEKLVKSEYDFIDLYDIESRYPSYTCTERGIIPRKQSTARFQIKELLNYDLKIDETNFSKDFEIDYSFENNSYIDDPSLIHPYVLGVLLGDGNMTATPSIANSLEDKEILEYVNSFLPSGYVVNKKTTKPGQCPQYSIVSTQKTGKVSFGKKYLEPLGLLYKVYEQKFIPEQYFKMKVEDRIWLLRGLMDTDGCCNKAGNFLSFSTVSPSLLNGVILLVRSLGGWSSINGPVFKKLKNKFGEEYLSRPLYGLSIAFPSEYSKFFVNGKETSSIFMLKRKAESYKPARSLANYKNFLLEIKPLGKHKLKEDIFLPEDHTFLIDDFIVTHNTTMARIIAHLLFDLGYIKEDKLIETDTNDFVQGEFTAQKTMKMLRQALGGVLFIDEAYNFSNLGSRGMESIALIVKFMEDHRDNIVVAFAGYAKEMNVMFLPLNSGLVSRIGYKFNIADYTEEELTAMYKLKLGLLGLRLDDSPKVKKAMEGPLSYAARSAKVSGNGRFVENLVQATMISHAKYMEQHPDADIHVITAESIPPIEQIMKVMR